MFFGVGSAMYYQHFEDEEEPEEEERQETPVTRRYNGLLAQEIAEILGDVKKRHSRYPTPDR